MRIGAIEVVMAAIGVGVVISVRAQRAHQREMDAQLNVERRRIKSLMPFV